MTKPIDNTAHKLGRAMFIARRRTYIPIKLIAHILRITEQELRTYESGRAEIPPIILTRIITSGYLAMESHRLNRECHILTRFVNKYDDERARQTNLNLTDNIPNNNNG